MMEVTATKSQFIFLVLLSVVPCYFSTDPNGYIAYCPCMVEFLKLIQLDCGNILPRHARVPRGRLPSKQNSICKLYANVCLEKKLSVLGNFRILTNGTVIVELLHEKCGRFGNQADHFLGAFGFSRGLNRTLILPPWVEYKFGASRSIQVSFDTYFQVKPLQQYHRVILMEEFMKDVAPTIWPPAKRIAFCYTTRGSSNGCNAKEGNPFGPFWDTFDVDFVGSQFYGPLHYDVHHSDVAFNWRKAYPSSEFPVLAFAGAPASFPVQPENKGLHKYLKWSENVSKEADNFIKTKLPRGSFIAIHLRNGLDWVRACEHIKSSPSLFAAPQCLGYRGEGGKATVDMCLPDARIVTKQVKRLARGVKDLVAVAVATDANDMLPELSKSLSRMEVRVIKIEGSSPHVELAVMGRANYFIGNCISSFSAFVVRERSVRGLPYEFWAYPPSPKSTPSSHDEL